MDKNKIKDYRKTERGSAGVKFLIVAMVLTLIANAGLNYIPVAYQAENFKQEMHKIVVQGIALPLNGASPTEVMKAKLTRAAQENELPPAQINVRHVNNVTSAHVRYSKEVSILPFGIYNYNYEFDHTATPSGFLMKN